MDKNQTSQPSHLAGPPAQAGAAGAGPAGAGAAPLLGGLLPDVVARAAGAPGAFELVGINELAERYGIKRTKVYRLTNQAGFPAPVAGERPRRYPLGAVLAWELLVALGPSLAAFGPGPAPAPPRPRPRGRPRKASAALGPEGGQR